MDEDFRPPPRAIAPGVSLNVELRKLRRGRGGQPERMGIVGILDRRQWSAASASRDRPDADRTAERHVRPIGLEAKLTSGHAKAMTSWAVAKSGWQSIHPSLRATRAIPQPDLRKVSRSFARRMAKNRMHDADALRQRAWHS